MTATTVRSSPITALVVARGRGATADELLELADNAIEDATSRNDHAALAEIAAELDAARAEHGPAGRGLAIAAARAHVALPELRLPVPESAATEAAAQAAPVAGEAAQLRYAGWWRRVAAFLIDWVLIVIVAELAWALFEPFMNPFLGAYFVLPFAYFAGCHALLAGRTVGKFVCGTAVRGAGGMPVGPAAVLGRTAAQVVLVVIPFAFFADSLWPVWDKRKQSLHDKAAGTMVIRVR